MRRRWPATLVLLSLSLACRETAKRQEPERVQPSASASPAATHAHTAPHGGTLVELGEEFAHVELVLDPVVGRLTAFILDGEAERSVRIAQPAIAMTVSTEDGRSVRVELQAAAQLLTGETRGDCSQFTGVASALMSTRLSSGSIENLTVRGLTFHDIAFGDG